MLRSAFLGEEGSKMAIIKFSMENKMLHNFQVNIFKYPKQVYWNVSSADDLKIANKNQSTRSQCLV